MGYLEASFLRGAPDQKHPLCLVGRLFLITISRALCQIF